MDILGADGLDRDMVDILGTSNAAIVLAQRFRQQHEKPQELADAVQLSAQKLKLRTENCIKIANKNGGDDTRHQFHYNALVYP